MSIVSIERAADGNWYPAGVIGSKPCVSLGPERTVVLADWGDLTPHLARRLADALYAAAADCDGGGETEMARRRQCHGNTLSCTPFGLEDDERCGWPQSRRFDPASIR